MTLRLPPEIEEQLKQVAETEHRSLQQTVLRLASPGIPDLYQGTELWDLAFVDPDNRRPVDFAARRRLLAEAASLAPEETWRRREEGLPKLWLIRKVLGLRQRRPEFFGREADYEGVFASGARAGST